MVFKSNQSIRQTYSRTSIVPVGRLLKLGPHKQTPIPVSRLGHYTKQTALVSEPLIIYARGSVAPAMRWECAIPSNLQKMGVLFILEDSIIINVVYSKPSQSKTSTIHFQRSSGLFSVLTCIPLDGRFNSLLNNQGYFAYSSHHS